MNRFYKSGFLKKLIGIFVIISFILIPQSGLLVNAKKAIDTQAPTAPQNLTATSVLQTSITLKWSASTDNKGISSYLIYQNSTQVAATSSLSYVVNNLLPDTTYTFFVKARDYSGNLSLSSNVLTVKTASVPSTTSPKISAGYYASWSAYSGYTPLNIPAAKLTHINYAFANIGSDLKITLGDPSIDLSNFSKLNQLKASYPHLKTLISVGGWEWSGKFSDVALTDSSRTIFADSVVSFIKQYGFDGVDLDWEYPVSGGKSTNIVRPEDKTNFTLLLQKIREKLTIQGNTDGKKYLLSIAGGAGSFYVSNTELNLLHNYLDYAVIMTYDIHGPWDTYTDFNAPLYDPSEVSPQYKWSVDSSVKAWVSKGFPASKIVVGIPFYGYVYSGVPNINNGLYNTYLSGTSVPYDKIKLNYINNTSFTKFYHAQAKVPWLFNGSVFVTYDDEQSIADKARYIALNNLAGSSVWELSQNTDGTLINALYSNMN